MADVKINELAPTVTPSGSMQFETDISGTTSNKITLNQIQAYVLQGNVASADKLATPRTINGVAFDGTINITVPAAAATLTGTALPAAVIGSSLQSVGTVSTGTWAATVIAPAYGGTGVNNGNRTLTLAGNLSTIGAFAIALTATAATNLTLPTAGTLATLAGAEALINKTVNGVTLTSAGSASQFLNAAGAYVTPTAGTVTSVSVVAANGITGTVATPSTTPAITLILGAITPSTVNGLTISATTATLALASGSSFSTVGGFSATLTATANTSLTLPVSGTLATLGGNETLTGKTLTAPVITGATIDSTSTLQGYRPTNPQTGASYTLVAADAGQHVALTNAAAISLIIPTNASVTFPIGTEIDFSQRGAGQVTFAPVSGVLVRSFGGGLKSAGQWAGQTLKKIGTDEWLLVGAISV